VNKQSQRIMVVHVLKREMLTGRCQRHCPAHRHPQALRLIVTLTLKIVAKQMFDVRIFKRWLKRRISTIESIAISTTWTVLKLISTVDGETTESYFIGNKTDGITSVLE
jgi:hypothetical protein